MREFSRPESMEAASSRRSSLVIELQAIEAALAGAVPPKANGQILTGRAYQQWRETAVTRKVEIIAELHFLKPIFRELKEEADRERAKWNVVENGADRFRVAKRTLADLFEYVEFLERDVAALKEQLKRAQEAEVAF